jgi:hypothetical protein
MTKYFTTLYIDDEECDIAVDYVSRKLEPEECGGSGVPGQTVIEIENISFCPHRKLEQALAAQITQAQASTAFDYQIDHYDWERNYTQGGING